MVMHAGMMRPTKQSVEPVDERVTKFVRDLINRVGRMKAYKLMGCSEQVFEEMRGEMGRLRPNTHERMKARVEELAGREQLVTG